MGFDLHITCTKDIDELHINFSDGTVSTVGPVNTKVPNGEGPKDSVSEPMRTTKKQGDFLDTETDFGGISQEVVKPPQIEREERGVNVAQELQNFDF